MEPFRSAAEGAAGISWLMATSRDKLKSGCFYLDGSVQPTHLAGAFFTAGYATKNTTEEVGTNGNYQPLTCIITPHPHPHPLALAVIYTLALNRALTHTYTNTNTPSPTPTPTPTQTPTPTPTPSPFPGGPLAAGTGDYPRSA